MYVLAYEVMGNCSTLEQFLQVMTNHPFWFDASGAKIPEARTDWLIQYWQAAHRTFRDVLELAELTNKEFAKRFFVPIRTVEDWKAEKRKIAFYTLILFQESMGIFTRRPTKECYTGIIDDDTREQMIAEFLAAENEEQPEKKPGRKRKGDTKDA